MSEESIEKIKDAVEEWYKAKERISFYEKQADRLKQKVSDYMKSKDVDTLVTTNHIVTKKQLSRDSLAKKDVPEDIWKKYAKNLSYEAYYIKEKI